MPIFAWLMEKNSFLPSIPPNNESNIEMTARLGDRVNLGVYLQSSGEPLKTPPIPSHYTACLVDRFPY
jgi:hypothetical protein